MRRPGVRLTIRRLMVAVAVVAFLIGAVRLKWLRDSHLHDAAYHARRKAEELRNVANFDRGRREGASNADDRSILLMEQSSRLRVAYHARLEQVYRRAANRPWRSVPPDPKDPGEDLLWESLRIPNVEFPKLEFLEFDAPDAPPPKP